jgi:hypothetical protein
MTGWAVPGGAGPTTFGWQTPPDGVTPKFIRGGKKKSRKSATGAVLHPVRNRNGKAAIEVAQLLSRLRLNCPRIVRCSC